jgi:hypothetical protein
MELRPEKPRQEVFTEYSTKEKKAGICQQSQVFSRTWEEGALQGSRKAALERTRADGARHPHGLVHHHQI